MYKISQFQAGYGSLNYSHLFYIKSSSYWTFSTLYANNFLLTLSLTKIPNGHIEKGIRKNFISQNDYYKTYSIQHKGERERKHSGEINMKMEKYTSHKIHPPSPSRFSKKEKIYCVGRE